MSCVAKRASGLPPQLSRRPYGVLRPSDARDVYAHPNQEFQRLAARGLLLRLATGYYALVPPGSSDQPWAPTLEDAAYGIAAADYGPDGSILVGLSAARLHGAVPRALAVAVVAIDKDRRTLTLARPRGTVRFAHRQTARLDAERIPTELGAALVTTVEQTLLDLAHRPDLGGVPDEARDAVRALWARADDDRLTELAASQRLKSALVRARTWMRR